MIKEFEFFHGVVLSELVHESDAPVSIQCFPSPSNASYVINGTIGIYIKHSSKRMTPWRFTFAKEHQLELELMRAKCERVYLLLVCNDDGIVCLSEEDVKHILDEQHDPVEWISATRRKHEMYTVKGSDGSLDFKVGQSDFPKKVFESRTMPDMPDVQSASPGALSLNSLKSQT
jgi:hypothetical protein